MLMSAPVLKLSGACQEIHGPLTEVGANVFVFGSHCSNVARYATHCTWDGPTMKMVGSEGTGAARIAGACTSIPFPTSRLQSMSGTSWPPTVGRPVAA